MRMHTWRKAGSSIGVSLLIAFLLVALSFHTSAQGQKNTAEFERLAQKAWRDGSVPVIVHLAVPNVGQLTAASAGVSAFDNSKGFGASRDGADARRRAVTDTSQAGAATQIAADGALRAAIDAVADTVLSELQGTAYTVNHRYGSIPFVALRASTRAITALQSSPNVLSIEEDVLVPLDPGQVASGKNAASPDEPQLDVSVPLIGAPTAWSWGFTGQGWYVAILDTGIRTTHQFFTGKTIIEACFALGADAVGGAGDCPNGNSTQFGSGSAAHHPSNYASYDHGTHVSGIATGNFGSLAGVAKNANIIAVQVFSKMANASLASWTSDTMAGLDYIYSLRGTYRIASSNLSLGSTAVYSGACDNDGRKIAIDNLRAAGIATAIATGNAGSCAGISSPGCISSSVSVGSSTDSDAESSFSNWSGSLQKLFAPGSSIYSSTAASDSSYASWSGTSMATPHVAGAWALMKQVVPNGSVNDFLAALRNTGVGISSVCDSRRSSMPRIRVDRAIATLARYILTIQSSQNGTTDPAPGAYPYAPGSQITVTALPAAYSDFVAWTGAASGNTNPLTVVMDADKTVVANFQYIFAPAASGRKVVNRSFSQIEYIDILSWQSNPSNQGLDINRYRIYRISGGSQSLVAEVSASGSAMEYQHRNAGLAAIQYAIVAVTSNNREGAPATVTVQ